MNFCNRNTAVPINLTVALISYVLAFGSAIYGNFYIFKLLFSKLINIKFFFRKPFILIHSIFLIYPYLTFI